MPRYMVQRTFLEGLEIDVTNARAELRRGVIGANAEWGVTWVHFYVSEDHKHSFCGYDAPTPACPDVRRVESRPHERGACGADHRAG